MKHAPKVHVWGFFSGRHGLGEIFVFDDYLDAPLMKKILDDYLLEAAKPWTHAKPRQDWWFQQDNDPKHKSNLVKDWIFSKGIQCIDWPPYSPDLNPIENLWADIKKRTEKKILQTRSHWQTQS